VNPRDLTADLHARYVWGFCRADFNLLATCFTADAQVGFPNGPRQGREAVLEELRRRRDGWSGAWIYVSNILILAANDHEIVAHATNAVIQHRGAEYGFSAVGWYEDRLRLEDGMWRIRERAVHLGSPAKPED